jgi:hypothetical protein
MKKQYIPPVQKPLGQVFDSLLILVLVYASLMVPLLFKEEAAPAPEPVVAQTAEAAAAAEAAKPTWESLGQNEVMQAQWAKLGYDPEKAAELINHRFDYTIDPGMLLLTILVVAGYFVFMLKVSEKEYREVIAEKFDS